MINDSNGGLVVCQGEGKSTCSEYGKKLKNLLMLMSALGSKQSLAFTPPTAVMSLKLPFKRPETLVNIVLIILMVHH